MAVKRIDSSIVAEMVRAALAAHFLNEASPGTYTPPLLLLPTDPDPDIERSDYTVPDRWARILRVHVQPRPRNSGDGHHDLADVVVLIGVYAAAEAAAKTADAASEAAQTLAAKLDMARLTHAATGHLIEMQRAEVTPDPAGEEDRGVMTAALTVAGIVQRDSGGTDGVTDSVRYTP